MFVNAADAFALTRKSRLNIILDAVGDQARRGYFSLDLVKMGSALGGREVPLPAFEFDEVELDALRVKGFKLEPVLFEDFFGNVKEPQPPGPFYRLWWKDDPK